MDTPEEAGPPAWRCAHCWRLLHTIYTIPKHVEDVRIQCYQFECDTSVAGTGRKVSQRDDSSSRYIVNCFVQKQKIILLDHKTHKYIIHNHGGVKTSSLFASSQCRVSNNSFVYHFPNYQRKLRNTKRQNNTNWSRISCYQDTPDVTIHFFASIRASQGLRLQEFWVDLTLIHS